jgi:predicted HicB family RNase H-like nuclease
MLGAAMTRQAPHKQERVIETVRLGLEGAAAVDFIHQSGFAISIPGIARYLKTLGGRTHVKELVDRGMSNIEILKACLPANELEGIPQAQPSQTELFVDMTRERNVETDEELSHHLYDTVKISLRLPADVYEAIRLASRAEQKTQNDLIVGILTRALSHMPERLL